MLQTQHQIQGVNLPNFYSMISNQQSSNQQLQRPINSPPLLPPIQLLKQTSSSQERISINGLQKSVHVVVKNAPFVVQIALTNQHFMNQFLDLNNFTFDAVLLYDSEGPQEKFVDYVKVKPVDHKPTVNENGDQVTIELRIKVLTSQHENSFFRVKIFLLDPNTGMPFHPSLVVFSEPVKVISKPEQVKKKAPAPAASSSTNANNSKKRNVNDLLLETISRIEEQQREHQQMIQKLLRVNENSKVSLHHQQMQGQQMIQLNGQIQPSQSYQQYPMQYGLPMDNMKQTYAEPFLTGTVCATPSPPPPATDYSMPIVPSAGLEESEFDSSFRHFFKVYNNLPAEEKPIKIRKLIRNSSQRDTEKISEFLDLFMTEGLQRIPPIDLLLQKNSPCECSTCPFTKEMIKIDEFYTDFLSLPLEPVPETNVVFE
eukprot:TRINITY_DN15128_c0_g1_i1.p1 TRINITY_DN15128_c0_g1~~TRINITY_DN15128_c0_g1_i1.p1  ORF type:complete len:428 (-),score=94.10 TRINITY_DN15128_c0_g1_i1:33-1316(-)